MIFGAHYERFPNPRPEDWGSDLKNMKAKGLTLARTWLFWRIVNPAEGVWDFSHYDPLFELALQHDVKIQIQMILEDVPEYLSKQHPDWHYQNTEGKYQKALGFDYANPGPKAMAEEYIGRVAQRYRDHPAFWGYDIWNETWLGTSLDSPWCQIQRAVFLQEKYGTIERLNKAYVRQYNSFEEVRDQRPDNKQASGTNYLPDMDADEFHTWMIVKMCQWRADTVRLHDPVHPVTSHGLQSASDAWEVHKPLDGWGISLHIGTIGGYLLPVCMSRSMTRAWEEEKAWWLAENGSGSTWYGLNSNRKSVHFLISAVVMGVMLKTTGVMFWQYRPEIKDVESPNFGLVKLNGEDTERSRAVAKFIAMFRCHEELFAKAAADPSPIGMVYSPAAYRMNKIVDSRLSEDFSGWHAALCQNGYIPDILRDIDLSAGIPAHIKMLVLPMEAVEPTGLRDALTVWVKGGGILVASGQTFLNDDLLYAQREYPGIDLFGVNENETDAYDGPVTCFGPETGRNVMPSGGRRIDCVLHGARPVGSIDGRPVVTVHNKGRGKAIWFGCAPGRTHDYTKSNGLCSVVSALMSDARLSPLVKATHGVVTTTLKNGKQRLTFVLNLTGRDAHSWLTLNEDMVTRVNELMNGRIVYDGLPTSCFPVFLESEQSCILSWEAC